MLGHVARERVLAKVHQQVCFLPSVFRATISNSHELEDVVHAPQRHHRLDLNSHVPDALLIACQAHMLQRKRLSARGIPDPVYAGKAAFSDVVFHPHRELSQPKDLSDEHSLSLTLGKPDLNILEEALHGDYLASLVIVTR